MRIRKNARRVVAEGTARTSFTVCKLNRSPWDDDAFYSQDESDDNFPFNGSLTDSIPASDSMPIVESAMELSFEYIGKPLPSSPPSLAPLPPPPSPAAAAEEEHEHEEETLVVARILASLFSQPQVKRDGHHLLKYLCPPPPKKLDPPPPHPTSKKRAAPLSPLPPKKLSPPLPALPPKKLSPPLPPKKLAAPLPPKKLSPLLPPKKLAAPLPPKKLSPLLPPKKLAAPLPPKKLASPLPALPSKKLASPRPPLQSKKLAPPLPPLPPKKLAPSPPPLPSLPVSIKKRGRPKKDTSETQGGSAAASAAINPYIVKLYCYVGVGNKKGKTISGKRSTKNKISSRRNCKGKEDGVGGTPISSPANQIMMSEDGNGEQGEKIVTQKKNKDVTNMVKPAVDKEFIYITDDFDDDTDDDGEEDEGGLRKRPRRPIKSRSLMSLM